MSIPTKKELTDLYNQPMSLVEMGTHYGVSNMTVKKWCVERGVKLRSHQDNQTVMMNKTRAFHVPDSAIKEYQSGWSLTQLATKYGMSVKPIRKKFLELGIMRTPTEGNALRFKK